MSKNLIMKKLNSTMGLKVNHSRSERILPDSRVYFKDKVCTLRIHNMKMIQTIQ